MYDNILSQVVERFANPGQIFANFFEHSTLFISPPFLMTLWIPCLITALDQSALSMIVGVLTPYSVPQFLTRYSRWRSLLVIFSGLSQQERRCCIEEKWKDSRRALSQSFCTSTQLRTASVYSYVCSYPFLLFSHHIGHFSNQIGRFSYQFQTSLMSLKSIVDIVFQTKISVLQSKLEILRKGQNNLLSKKLVWPSLKFFIHHLY